MSDALLEISICATCAVNGVHTGRAALTGTDLEGRFACEHVARPIAIPNDDGFAAIYYNRIAREIRHVDRDHADELGTFLLAEGARAAVHAGLTVDHFIVLAKAAYDDAHESEATEELLEADA